MNASIEQQFILGGVGGQGVLFITRVMAEMAIGKGLSVLTSETHGMAQRGGTVISHLKVGPFSSSMVRTGQADGLLALKGEAYPLLQGMLKPNGWAAVNAAAPTKTPGASGCFYMDADSEALRLGLPRSANLFLLGYTTACLMREALPLFWNFEDLGTVLAQRFSRKPLLLEGALKAVEAGKAAGEPRKSPGR